MRATTYHRIACNMFEHVFDFNENEDLRGRYDNPNQECSETGQRLLKVSMEGESKYGCARIIENTHGRDECDFTNADRIPGVGGGR
jgi:hypothetical protein